MPELFSLAARAWLPIVRISGQCEFVRLCDISDPTISHLATGRPDCDTTLAEFLIGLLAVAIPPEDNGDWRDLYNEPPSAEALAAAFAPFADALVLDGDGPRFFQDREALIGDATRVESLFIDAPADHFRVDARYEVLSRTGAAIALLTLQTMAPSGGAGHRTSLRGGGPLTTFVVPREQPTLWQRLWANVPNGEPAKAKDAPKIFPWLAPTRTSNPKDGGVITTPADVSEAQAYFGMPRRIRLTFEPNTLGRGCDLLGSLQARPDNFVVRTYVTKPWGTNYPSHAWSHPLSPYYRQKKGDADWLPRHMKGSRVGYRDWLALVTSPSSSDAGALTRAAANVATFRNARAIHIGESRHIRLQACGYALDNMKPLDFAEAIVPLFTGGSPQANDTLDSSAAGLISAAEEVAGQLTGAVRRALYGEKAKVDAGSSVLSAVASRFWSETEADFYCIVGTIAEAISGVEAGLGDHLTASAQQHGRTWLAAMRKVALAIFDDTAPIEDSDPARLQDVVAARKFLSLAFQGHGPTGNRVYAALELPAPEKADNAKRGTRKAAKEKA